MRFCETKPFVMLRESDLCGTGRRSCADYREMTNGFVSVRNAHAQSHYPTGLETTRGGLAPSQGARLSGNEGCGEGSTATERRGYKAGAGGRIRRSQTAATRQALSFCWVSV